MYDNNDNCNSRKKLTCKSQVRTDSNKFSFYPWTPDFEKKKKKQKKQKQKKKKTKSSRMMTSHWTASS